MFVKLFLRYVAIFGVVYICNPAVTCAEEEAKQTDKTQLEELLYKNTLFHYYSGDYISALTKILINEKRLLANVEADRTKVLQGGIYLAYGLDYDAKRIFEYMNTETLDEELRNVIWFYLGKDFYNNFDYLNAADSLEKITKDASYNSRREKYNILSNSYVYTNSVNKLEALLAKATLNDNDRQYMKFNLAIAYLKNNQEQKGKDLLAELSGEKIKNVEQSTIADKSKLHLANLSFKEKNYQQAIKYIDEMDANGLYSDSAIYLSALSHSISGNTKKAYSLLTALKSRESKNIYNYYSVLLIARILEQNGNFEQALNILNDGLSKISSEKEELDSLLNKIRKDFFLTDLSKTKDGEIIVTNKDYKKLVDELVFSKDFANHYDNYIDLVELKKTIRHWQNQIPQLSIMLKERDIYFRKKKETVSVVQFKKQKDDFLQRLSKLRGKYVTVENTNNINLLYTETELEQADDLEYLEGKVNRLAKHQDMSDFQEKIRIMKGLNYWKAATDFQPRIWDAKTTLESADNEISTLTSRINSLEKASKSEFHYSQYVNEIKNLSNRMSYLNRLLDSTIARIKEQMILIAADELDRRFKGIDAYQKAFKFDVARVSDRIFINKK